MEDSTLKSLGIFLLGAVSGWTAKTYSKEIKSAATDSSIGSAVSKWLGLSGDNSPSAPSINEETPEELARKAAEKEKKTREETFEKAKEKASVSDLENLLQTVYRGNDLIKVKSLLKEGKILAKGHGFTDEWEIVTLEEARDNDKYLSLIRAIASKVLERS